MGRWAGAATRRRCWRRGARDRAGPGPGGVGFYQGETPAPVWDKIPAGAGELFDDSARCWMNWACRRWMACCWTWGCRRGNWTPRSAGSHSNGRGRSTCGWTRSGTTAADIVNTAPAGELVRIFRQYGEEPNARRIAARIVSGRAVKPFRDDDATGAGGRGGGAEAGADSPGDAGFPGAADRGEPGDGGARERAGAGGGAAADRRTDGGDYVSLAGGPDGEGVFQAPLDARAGSAGVAGAEAEPGLHFSRADTEAGHRERGGTATEPALEEREAAGQWRKFNPGVAKS